MIKKQGYKEYDPTVLRSVGEGYKERKYEPNGLSMSQKINSGANGTINQEILDAFLSEKNFTEVKDFTTLKNVDKGSRVCYIRNDKDKFISGGFLVSVNESDTDYDGNKHKEPRMYILYRGFNNVIFSLQGSDIFKLYVADTKKTLAKKNVETKLIYFKKPKKETKYSATLKNSDSVDTVVYYGKDNFALRKFLSTNKYKKAQENPSSWAFA